MSNKEEFKNSAKADVELTHSLKAQATLETFPELHSYFEKYLKNVTLRGKLFTMQTLFQDEEIFNRKNYFDFVPLTRFEELKSSSVILEASLQHILRKNSQLVIYIDKNPSIVVITICYMIDCELAELVKPLGSITDSNLSQPPISNEKSIIKNLFPLFISNKIRIKSDNFQIILLIKKAFDNFSLSYTFDEIKTLLSQTMKEKITALPNRAEEQGREACNNPIVKELLEKYLKGKGLNLKIFVTELFEDKNNLAIFLQDKGFDKGYYVNVILQTIASKVNSEEFFNDVKMLNKLLQRQGQSLTNIQIVSVLHYLICIELRELIDPIISPVYDAISNNKEINDSTIIEKLVLHIRLHNIEIENYEEAFILYLLSKRLHEKLNRAYPKKQYDFIRECISKIDEEIALDEFERNLDDGNVGHLLNDRFDELDGYQFENYLKELFQHLGYTVINTKLSGDQGADLVLSKNGVKTVVQAKNYNSPVSNDAVQEVVASKNHYNADKSLVVCTGTYTKSAIELAYSNHVDLWDRTRLQNIIKEINKKSSIRDKYKSI